VGLTCSGLFLLLFWYMVFREFGATFTPSMQGWDEHERIEPERVIWIYYSTNNPAGKFLKSNFNPT
tara:strand:- start:1992 stop:2189 length:198 start_codon:yes stop_codon:yes gene_type:complete